MKSSYGWRLVVLGVSCLGCGAAPHAGLAARARSGEDPQRPVWTLRRDLNDDGKADSIRLTRMPAKDRKGPYALGSYRLTVNGRTVIEPYPEAQRELVGFYLVDLDRRDRFMEIVVEQRFKDYDGSTACIYWYTGSRLKRVHDATVAWHQFPGNGTATAQLERHGFWAVVGSYRLRGRDHRLVPVPQKWYPVNVTTPLTKALPLRAAPGGAVTGTVPPGRKITFLQGDRKGKWYRVRSAGGSQGWIEFQPAHESGCFGQLAMAG